MMVLGRLQALAEVDLYMLAALLVCCLVTGHGLKARPLWGLRLAVTVLAECLWAGACSYEWLYVQDSIWSANGIVVAKYLGTFLLTIAAFRFCLRCCWTAALYGGTTGYILQHCAERTAEVVQALLPPHSVWGDKLILVGSTALMCVCFVFVFRRRYDILEYDRYGGENDIMLVTAATVVGVIIVMEPLIRNELQLGTDAPVMIYIHCRQLKAGRIS